MFPGSRNTQQKHVRSGFFQSGFTLRVAESQFKINPANTKTAGGYTASNIRQASLELGGVPIPLFDVGLGGILKGSHPDLSYIQNRTCDSA